MRCVGLAVILLVFSSFGAKASSVLEGIETTGKIKIGYRVDAPPFSYRNEIGEAAGYTVDLCRAVAVLIGKRLRRSVTLDYVPVTAKSRFAAIRSGKVDLLCGSTTETLSRRKLVDFSVTTFVTGASVLFRENGPRSFRALSGRTIGVTGGTTTERDLTTTLQSLSLKARVLRVSDHREGLRALQTSKIDAYFGDRAILMAQLMKSGKTLVKLKLSKRHFSVEPYALAMPLGNTDFRNLVDWALSYIYKSGSVIKIFRNSFGNSEPSDFIKAMFVINALSE
jgi:ABC-type amino acid transport substrate-binding protein